VKEWDTVMVEYQPGKADDSRQPEADGDNVMIRDKNSTAYPAGNSVQDQVYTALRKSIINLNLIPGTVVSEKEIALRFQVSRTPLPGTAMRTISGNWNVL
jgi:hypothetical protein